MTNVLPFLDPRGKRSRLRQQAAEWLARIDAGASPEELDSLGEWLVEDAAHLKAFLDMASLWDQTAVIAELSDVFPLELYSPAKRQRRQLLMAAAGSLAAATLAGGWLLHTRDRTGEVLLRQSWQTAVGEQSTVELPDGSTFILNTASSVEVAFSAGARQVFLTRGEAMFDVASDPSRPFRVFAGGRMVEAVGTAFTVQFLEEARMEVIVTEGRVRVLPHAGSPDSDSGSDGEAFLRDLPDALSLGAGEFAAVGGAGGGNEVTSGSLPLDQLEARLSWRHGMHLFQGETLTRVLEEVGRYTAVRIEAEDAILDIRVQAYFQVGDIDGMLTLLALNLGIGHHRLGQDHILLTAHTGESPSRNVGKDAPE